MGFSELPPELLILILDSLAIKELLRCKQVCKSLNALVQDETALQYKVQLNLAGTEDGPATNPLAVRDRLRILVKYMEAWDQLRFSEIRTMDRESGNLWELYGNVLAETRSENTTLVIKQLPSKLRGINERTWTLDNLHIPLCDFSTDVAQNLVALLEPRNMPDCLPNSIYTCVL
ncbi:unnamed protein product [Somion occarium]|uniref:F-box domain-containing protein n=1 Tax=Somion occarium TaxID=3059160 RepID=A0ABP1D6M7_9APHY